jgi:S1-C subfamily serine protease
MKKLLGIVVLGLLWCNVSLAATFLLPERSGKETFIYNLWIKDYNNFKKNFVSDVHDYCIDQMVGGAGAGQFLDQARCEYRAGVDLANRFSIHTDPLKNIVHHWHLNLFSLAKTVAIAQARCRTNRCDRQLIDEYIKKKYNLVNRLFKDLDREIQKKASRENAEYYAKKKKKKKEEGPKIDDNEILPASSGTGFFVSKEGHVVTNYHVISGCKPVNVLFEGKDYEAKVLAIDKMNDLAILKTDLIPKSIYTVSKKDPQMTEIVFVAGYPLGKSVSSAIKASKGIVTALAGLGDNYAEFQTDAALNSGNSGGPIINKQGKVIGIAVSKLKEAEGFNFGIKVSILKVFASANDLNLSKSSATSIWDKLTNKGILNDKEREDLMTEATLYIECWMNGKQIKRLIAKKNSVKAFYSKYKK